MPTKIHVRQAHPDDAETLLAVVRAIISEPGIDLPLTAEEFAYSVEEERKILQDFATSANSVFLVVEVDGELAGGLSCKGGTRKTTRHTTTLGVSLLKKHRGQGVGRALMTAAVDWARGTGIVKRIELSVYCRNEVAIHLYKTLGFEIEGRRRKSVFQDGEYLDEWTMALLLQGNESPTDPRRGGTANPTD